MTRRMPFAGSAFMALALVVAVSTAHAQAPADFAGDPDKTMASAHESFVKGNMKRAADQVDKAAAYVRKESGQVTKSTRAAVVKASDQLKQLGADIKKGSVKSGDQLKKVFAQVDHQLAGAWHTTAEQARKSGKDATAALKKAGDGLEGAAKWSGTQLKEGTQASVDGLKKAGKGVKLGAEDVERFFKQVGDGIAEVGQKITS